MKKLGILISSPKPKKIRKSVSEWAEEIRKSGPHKYVKREGSPGNYKYYYRLPNGGIGTREDLEAATRGKKPEDQKGKRPLNFYEPGKPKRDQAAAARRKIPANAPKLGIRISGIDVKGNKVSGEVTNQGADGVTIDHKNHIAYGNVTSTEGGGQDTTKTATKKEWVDPENFNAAEWKKQWDNPKANKDNAGVESIMNSFEMLKDEIERHVKETDAKNYELIYTKQLTYQLYRKIGEGPSSIYSKERVELHDEIEREIMAPDKIHSANPAVGEKPTFIMLGGRGGSGKSWFQNNIYDPGKFVILDADVIKERISEYDGWNANQVHEESSDILEKILQKCLEQGDRKSVV
jgi:hypothetical protein